MPGRQRDTRFDALATGLIKDAANAPGRWLTFRFQGEYADRLALQRSIFYLRSQRQSVRVQWLDADGTWQNLTTPRGSAEGRLGTVGGPQCRLRIHSKSEGRTAAKDAIKAGRAAYNTLTR